MNEKFKKFMVVWFGQFVSMLGSGISSFGLSLWIFMMTKSATTFAMTFLVQILPGIIFAPFAGSMADRKQRKHIIVLTDSLDAVLKVILMILLATGSMKVWMVYPLTFLSQTLGTFQNPAFNATIPLLVEKKDIPRANGFMQLIRAIQNMLAPLIAGALFPFIGLTGLFAIDFVTFFVAILTILPQKIEQEIEEVKESNFTKTIVSDLKIAFEVLKQKQGFIQIIVVFSILNFVANIAMVLVGPLVMSNYDTKIYGLVNSVSGIAMVLGGVISGAIPSEKNKVRSIFLSLIICSIGMIVMGINYSWIVMICTLFTGQTSKEGIFMKYSYEFKKECVQLYREGRWADTPEGVKEKRFHDTIKEWFKLEEKHGPEILKHRNNIEWTTDEKLEVVSKVLAGNTIGSVAIEIGINRGQLYSWVNKYKIYGYNGLVNKKKGRKSKNTTMKKTNIHEAKKLNESEREELIRLRAENEYIKAENEIIKKEIALREKNYAAQLKAKKQRLSKNSKKKDTD